MARINVLNVYPKFVVENGNYVSYDPMVSAFAQRVVVAVDEASRHGDAYRLLADGDEPDQKYGLLVFGWGSCSGCDALQSCRTVADLQQLADALQDSIKWFRNKNELREYMEQHDWQGDWTWHKEEAHYFRREVEEFLDSCLL